jgi:hypothetical protein
VVVAGVLRIPDDPGADITSSTCLYSTRVPTRRPAERCGRSCRKVEGGTDIAETFVPPSGGDVSESSLPLTVKQLITRYSLVNSCRTEEAV